MKRIHPLFSLLSLSFAVLLFAGLGWMMWRHGNLLFSPGKLSGLSRSGVALAGYASHADFESECSLCHAPLETTQDVLCLQCHTQVREEIVRQEGAHGVIASVDRCAECHPEHSGRDFNQLEPAMAKFDHSMVSFDLEHHRLDYDHARMDCIACHEMSTGFSTPPEKCAQCHASNDPSFMQQHIQDFGQSCVDCHDGHDRMIDFDHASVFPLEGAHAEATCAACHGSPSPAVSLVSDSLSGQPATCTTCHAEPATHRGMFGANCVDCHTSTAWSPASWEGFAFDHMAASGFSLARHAVDYAGQPMDCVACHTGRIELRDHQSCITCHSSSIERAQFLEQHMAQFSQTCLDCHDGVDRMIDFDHASVFPLEGAHTSAACQDCHKNQIFRGTPNQCVDCHAEPNIHAGFFGLQCQNCHSTEAWSPAGLKSHSFPLDHGGRGEVACETCHTSSYTEYTCYGCHDHQPEEMRQRHAEQNISEVELEFCVQCHPDGHE